jgi:4-amino-4-deoxy-L-arabinose transferase-like glycosyltransferase
LSETVSRRRLILPALLLTIYVAQCLWFIGTQSLTCDEPAHMVAGLEALRDNKFEFLNDQPPLARVMFAAPLLLQKTQIYWYEWLQVRATTPSPEVIAWTGRPVNVLLGVILGIALWRTARKWFSEDAANFALALFAFSPGMIAHFSVMTVDGISTLMIFLTALQIARWWRDPSTKQTALLGVVLGLLLLAKFYTPPMFVLAFAMVLILKPGGWKPNPMQWNWRQGIAVFLIAGLVVWAGYFFHVSHVSFDKGHATVTFPNRGENVGIPYRGKDFNFSVPFHANFNLLVPAAEYLEGVWLVKEHNKFGHPTFLLGRISRMGWNLYYPIAIVLKWPTIVLLCALGGLVLAIRRRISLPAEWRVMLLFPALLFAMAIFSSIQIGDRHILPLYPFLLLIAAGLWEWAKQKRAWRGVLVLAVLLNAADVLRYAPDYLSYFNIFVKPDRSWTLLSDSNVDWGSGLLALREYQQKHPNDEIHLGYFGSVDAKIYGIRYTQLGENEHATGTVIVSAMDLTGHSFRDPLSFRWVLQYPRKAILNHTLYVFDVPQDKSK